MVRLYRQDRTFFADAEIRIPQVRRRTLRHRGVLYELMHEDGGVKHYRATEPIAEPVPILADVMNGAGVTCGHVPIASPDTPPASVEWQGMTCPLWTRRDQQGHVVYLAQVGDV